MPDTRKQQQSSNDRTGKYGGDDGALEHEREEIQTGEDPGIKGTPVPTTGAETPAQQAKRQQQRDLATGAENPG